MDIDARTVEGVPGAGGVSNLPDTAKVQRLLRALSECGISLPPDANPGDPGRFTDLLLVACMNSKDKETSYGDYPVEVAGEGASPVSMSLDTWAQPKEPTADEARRTVLAFESMLPGRPRGA